jgi:G3E family GTPase
MSTREPSSIATAPPSASPFAITGFLGSGKTTLVNRLLQQPEMADSAVIINEFGEIALDHLLVEPVAGEAVVLASGCLCCAVRGDLQDALRRLLVQRDRGEVPAFCRVLIETSGLADPAPVVQLLLNNPLLGHDLRLDTVVATVDGTVGPAKSSNMPRQSSRRHSPTGCS